MSWNLLSPPTQAELRASECSLDHHGLRRWIGCSTSTLNARLLITRLTVRCIGFATCSSTPTVLGWCPSLKFRPIVPSCWLDLSPAGGTPNPSTSGFEAPSNSGARFSNRRRGSCLSTLHPAGRGCRSSVLVSTSVEGTFYVDVLSAKVFPRRHRTTCGSLWATSSDGLRASSSSSLATTFRGAEDTSKRCQEVGTKTRWTSLSPRATRLEQIWLFWRLVIIPW